MMNNGWGAVSPNACDSSASFVHPEELTEHHRSKVSRQGACGVPEVGLCVCVHQGSGHIAVVVKCVSSAGSRHCGQQGAVSVCACCSQQHKPAVVKKPPMYEHLPGGLWAEGTERRRL